KGAYLVRKGDFAGALGVLIQAAKAAPSSEAFTAIAEALIGLQKIPDAMDALNKAISLNPENAHAFYLHANCHRLSQQFQKAVLLY
ncbi:hypothetical protein NL393_36250, partial [Klebsiella pneumoniae]|nr:hypothetical protein [Klebsiella pneumoniae]